MVAAAKTKKKKAGPVARARASLCTLAHQKTNEKKNTLCAVTRLNRQARPGLECGPVFLGGGASRGKNSLQKG